MNVIEVIDLVIHQMGELRIPLRETELRERLVVIAGNIQALRDAVAQAGADASGAEEAKEEKADV